MLARTTLALMLACPAATSVLISSGSAFAAVSKTCKDSCTTHHATFDRRASQARRSSSERYAFHRQSTPAAETVTLSRLFPGPDADLGPGSDAVAAQPIPLASAGGARSWQTGMASWYGGARWQGHMTSSGHCYDENALTAAHASLPLGSQAIVRLVGSDRSVVVTITDRPGTRRRVIDLSRAAAAQLGILSRGIALVSIDPL